MREASVHTNTLDQSATLDEADNAKVGFLTSDCKREFRDDYVHASN